MGEREWFRLFRAGLSMKAVAVFGFIASHTGPERLSGAFIARGLGIGQSTVSAALRELQDAGVLTVRRNPFAPSEYVIHPERLRESRWR